MPKIELTHKAIQGFPPPEKGRIDVYDTKLPGLVVRVSATGAKSYSISYWKSGKRQRVTLGKTSLITLAEARERGRAELRKVTLGIDPAEEKRKEKQEQEEQDQALTFEQLADDYIKRWLPTKRPKGAAEDKRRIERILKPKWGKKKAKDIRKRDVVELLDEIQDAGKTYARNRMQSLLSKIFCFWMERDDDGRNPTDKIRREKEKRRKRPLTDDELKILLPLFRNPPADDIPRSKKAQRDRQRSDELAGLGFRFLLLTAQRPAEVFGMRWSEVDDDIWKLPAERCKSHRSMEDAGQAYHAVPLSSQAMSVLHELKRWDNGSGYVFPSVQKQKSFTSYQKLYRRIKAAAKLSADWEVYDLKTTAITGMEKKGVKEPVYTAIANHVPQGVTRKHYAFHDYAPEKREALAAWGRHVETLDPWTTAKVIEMHRT